MLPRGDLSLAELFGLSDPHKRLQEAKLALGGDPYTPASRWGLSSIGIFHPRLSVKTWLGHYPHDRLVPITNFFNHTPTPVEDGWSVQKTQVQDFRGQRLTYNSHNGTDFAIPAGTVVTAPAPGRVLRISNEFHRGGLKVVIDHGFGLITTSNHLGRALVDLHDDVERGQPIALSAYSGIDALAAFPWSVPHVHFNTWLNGTPVDPFARPDTGESSLWRSHNDPKPFHPLATNSPEDLAIPPASTFHLDHLQLVINGCRDPRLRQELNAQQDPHRRAVDTIFMKNYFPTRFTTDLPIYAHIHERRPILDLPFQAEDYDGVRFLP